MLGKVLDTILLWELQTSESFNKSQLITHQILVLKRYWKVLKPDIEQLTIKDVILKGELNQKEKVKLRIL